MVMSRETLPTPSLTRTLLPVASNNKKNKNTPEERLELPTYRLTAGRATDCATQDFPAARASSLYVVYSLAY